MSRLLLKTSSPSQYSAIKASAQGGTVLGVPVSLKTFDDSSMRIYLECSEADFHTLLGSSFGASAWEVESYTRNYSDSEAFALAPDSFAAGAAWQADQS